VFVFEALILLYKDPTAPSYPHPNAWPPTPILYNLARGRNGVLRCTDGHAGYFGDFIKQNGRQYHLPPPQRRVPPVRPSSRRVDNQRITSDAYGLALRANCCPGMKVEWAREGPRGKAFTARDCGMGPLTTDNSRRTTSAVKPRPKAKPVPSH
jgi:hypothetical protein